MKVALKSGPLLPFFFEFEEESDYGQEILELIGMVTELADPDGIYSAEALLCDIEECVTKHLAVMIYLVREEGGI